MTKQVLRVAIVGGIRRAESYVALLQDDPRVRIVGVGEDPQAPEWLVDDSRQASARFGLPWNEGLGDWLTSDHVDIAVVCGEPARQARLAQMVLAKGVDVVVEKPVGLSLVDVDELISVAQASGRICSVVNRTHAPALRRLRDWIDAGHLGLPVHFDMEFFASSGRLVDSAFAGVREVRNLLGCCADAIHFASGLEVESVYALTGSLFSQQHSMGGDEDCSVVSLGLQHGVTATVTVGRIPCPPSHGATSTSMRVLGSHAHAVVDDDRPALEIYTRGSEFTVDSFDGGHEALRACLAHIIESSLRGRSSDYTAVQARRSLAVVDACCRSARSGMPKQPR